MEIGLSLRARANSKEKYDELNEAVKWMRTPYFNAAEFIEDQIDKTIQRYKESFEIKEL
jgi:hypothetical protein